MKTWVKIMKWDILGNWKSGKNGGLMMFEAHSNGNNFFSYVQKHFELFDCTNQKYPLSECLPANSERFERI